MLTKNKHTGGCTSVATNMLTELSWDWCDLMLGSEAGRGLGSELEVGKLTELSAFCANIWLVLC